MQCIVPYLVKNQLILTITADPLFFLLADLVYCNDQFIKVLQSCIDMWGDPYAMNILPVDPNCMDLIVSEELCVQVADRDSVYADTADAAGVF